MTISGGIGTATLRSGRRGARLKVYVYVNAPGACVVLDDTVTLPTGSVILHYIVAAIQAFLWCTGFKDDLFIWLGFKR